MDITQLVRVSDCDSESTGSSPVICPKKSFLGPEKILTTLFFLHTKEKTSLFLGFNKKEVFLFLLTKNL